MARDKLTSFLDDGRLVIHEIAKQQTPSPPYTDEWKILDTDDVPLNERYAAVGLIEQVVPVFPAINLVALVWDRT